MHDLPVHWLHAGIDAAQQEEHVIAEHLELGRMTGSMGCFDATRVEAQRFEQQCGFLPVRFARNVEPQHTVGGRAAPRQQLDAIFDNAARC